MGAFSSLTMSGYLLMSVLISSILILSSLLEVGAFVEISDGFPRLLLNRFTLETGWFALGLGTKEGGLPMV